MKRFITPFLLLIVAALAQPSLAADSAKKIVDRYKKASGARAIKRVKSSSMSGVVKTADGMAGRFAYKVAGPDRLRLDIDLTGFKMSECYNGKSAWRMDERGLRTLLGAEAKRLRLEALVANSRLQDLSRNRIIAAPPAKATIEGREANAVEFSKDDARVKIFFDAKTNLPVKQERERAEELEEVFYGDYRAVDGVMEPFSIKIKSGARELNVTMDRVEHNAAVDETAFRYPQVEGARPLPDLESLFKAVIANQEKVEEMRERYSFRALETERKLEKDGRVKETETKVYDVTPVAGEFVERLISVNGKELTAAEREKEDRRVQKEVEDAIKRREKRLKKEEQARASGKKEEDDDDDITILDFLRISEVTSVRREVFRGHEVIAFDFEPRKGFKPKNRAETIVSKLAGTTWVDENARQIVRLEARLTNSFKMGGGLLASISPSSAFAFEQEKVGDEVWLPSYGEANISARIMLFAKFNRSMERRYSDYKKYQIDSDYELAKPKETKPDQQQ
ncbi:MAG TPA: hypothetical protein VFO63_21050 [Blastocatellia bacterium]|nr:hypothetical protein [Blastocatellia bacterium]